MTDATPLNPYAAGGPLTDPSGRGFFGRDDIFQFVRAFLSTEQRTPILLYGQRRIGKSSVLRQLKHRLPSDYVTVFFDLQGKASMNLDQVLYGLGRDMADALHIARPSREEAAEDTFAGGFLPRAIAAVDGRPERLVLLFDEFDVVDERIAGSAVAARRFIGYLAELIAQAPRIGYVLVVGRKTEELSEELNAALLKGAVQKYLGRLDQRETARLIVEPATSHLHFTPDAVHRIWQLTAGHPYCVQVLCNTLWNRCVAEGKVTAPDVDGALPGAIEVGTLGLNWIFDGLTEPAHRLFLSALAGIRDPAECTSIPVAQVESALRAQRLTTSSQEFLPVLRDLQRWDILGGSAADGIRFAVPMVGSWVRQERSLERLGREARFANPRAYSYYELALEAHQRGDLDRAISDYRGALQANSQFLEAQKGLAVALRDAGNFAGAIEAFERVRELDTAEPVDELLDTLLASLDAEAADGGSSKRDGPATAVLVQRFARIKELGGAAHAVPRAHRALVTIARRMDEHGQDGDAIALLDAAGETAALETARRARTRRLRLAVGTGVAAALLAVIGIYLVATAPATPSLLHKFSALLPLALGAAVASSFVGSGSMLRRLNGWSPAEWLIALPVTVVAAYLVADTLTFGVAYGTAIAGFVGRVMVATFLGNLKPTAGRPPEQR